jgi:iron complex transport system substrate-binding protein
MHRIISLIASATEIVHSLGFGGEMVGRSHECDFPNAVKNLPVCTEPKFSIDGSSYAIDQRVKAIVQEGLSVYRVHADIVDGLMPTHIITQTQCEVCAVSQADVEAAACELIGGQVQIVSLKADKLEDIWKDISLVGTALGAKVTADDTISALKMRLNAIARKAACLKGKRVAVIEWMEPLMIAGNWIPELLEICGAEAVPNSDSHRSSTIPCTIQWQDLLASDPDVIIVSPCGFDVPRILTEMPLLSRQQDYAQLKAVQTDCVAVVDGNQYMNRPGPRILESLEIMAEIIHPRRFDFGHLGSGWVRYRA